MGEDRKYLGNSSHTIARGHQIFSQRQGLYFREQNAFWFAGSIDKLWECKYNEIEVRPSQTHFEARQLPGLILSKKFGSRVEKIRNGIFGVYWRHGCGRRGSTTQRNRSVRHILWHLTSLHSGRLWVYTKSPGRDAWWQATKYMRFIMKTILRKIEPFG